MLRGTRRFLLGPTTRPECNRFLAVIGFGTGPFRRGLPVVAISALAREVRARLMASA